MNFFEIEETEKNLDIKKNNLLNIFGNYLNIGFKKGIKNFLNQYLMHFIKVFCLKYGYEFGKFDLEEHRKLPPVQLIKHKKNNLTYLWGEHPNDFKILKPIFLEEKEKYKKLKPT